MKLAKIRLKNFRSYRSSEVTFDENFSVIIGKNDIGKSTILEALEIFFNNETVKIDIDDYNVHSNDGEMSIQLSFFPEQKGYTIDTIPTSLTDEYLLDSDKLITLRKTWDCSKGKLTASSLKTYLIANYPKAFSTPLISEKITDLRKILGTYSSKIDVEEVKKNTSSEIRKAIYAALAPMDCQEIEIAIDKEDGKKIWEALKADLPLFFIFQADRENRDSDKEVQDPLKAITRSVIAQLEAELEAVKVQIQSRAEDIGMKTLEKLKEMNPDIAEVLSPSMSNKPWESLFSFSFTSDDGIPINKRGSGVRRLILLNYFRAEAERQNATEKNVIYAIEEPETSQHPDWQVTLFEALIKLSQRSNTQLITTTHSPALAGIVRTDSVIFVYREQLQIKIEKGSATNLQKIADTLGILPDISVNDSSIKVVFCVEGPLDIVFFNHIGKLFEVDMQAHPEILTVCLGGGTLHHWVNQNYLAKLGKPQIHIYDRDVPSYKEAVDKVNQMTNSWAATTTSYEIENYVHPSLIKNLYPVGDTYFLQTGNWAKDWANKDVPKTLSEYLKKMKADGNKSISGESSESIKRLLSEQGAKLMTMELLTELGTRDEVSHWFDQIKKHLS
jgi:putative ATP-dependent endonuclease of the OLD family